ncbi:CpaD family pilus assembly protein [Aquihabitans sp. G128]|uniref:CpaD family pilus assembly protein n=1 Tax=Aquihabitans sp. G128 TaxID=2849779 RepID=UPI001C23E2D1|nr:CpaD family pilus assembly protein [Aquihabitans sp. G128]QXC60819.1 CpaD family pilus assembly protein [Aquihabitans sp. G128]
MLTLVALLGGAFLLAGCYSTVPIPGKVVDWSPARPRHPIPFSECPSPVSNCCAHLKLGNGVIAQFPRERTSTSNTYHSSTSPSATGAYPFTVKTYYENWYDSAYRQRGCRNAVDVWWYTLDGRINRKVVVTTNAETGGVNVRRDGFTSGWR